MATEPTSEFGCVSNGCPVKQLTFTLAVLGNVFFQKTPAGNDADVDGVFCCVMGFGWVFVMRSLLLDLAFFGNDVPCSFAGESDFPDPLRVWFPEC